MPEGREPSPAMQGAGLSQGVDNLEGASGASAISNCTQLYEQSGGLCMRVCRFNCEHVDDSISVE